MDGSDTLDRSAPIVRPIPFWLQRCESCFLFEFDGKICFDFDSLRIRKKMTHRTSGLAWVVCWIAILSSGSPLLAKIQDRKEFVKSR
jgi:hypothetical protein